MARRNRVALPKVRMALPEGPKGSRGPPGDPGGVRRPSRRAEKGWVALLKGREGLGGASRGLRGLGGPPRGTKGVVGTPRGLGEIGRFSRRVGMPFRRVRRPSQRAGWCRESLPKVREGSGGNPGGLGGCPGGPGELGRSFRRSV